ncbi:TPA: hypothetical protein DEP34_02920 [Candidatus Uhrbacteria bacterium]|uniref:Uncharacterized protein n=2 Tax=Candidatus Uhriibacteriota TaxID=1752732 RepID=A0A0G1Q8S9_9BACT|nr:MAG: hypothetical protein UX45_C0001G0027 [Candidatus Uhrbacteria bacterium GW2011_GWF2_46_218]KKU41409.1 MAG: hypothetical protein UX57_C0004G0113 [Candidatus Uhrbacteria bacterium GW2011_GWE2_46_68]HBK33845.1 hypothetical protein [Candidatus Uhrbacteria bacterium]HCB19315.1 hypothetical protein [Candidatus Uhrbacteria bacterium]
MGFFEKFSATLGFGKTPKQAAPDVQTRLPDRVDRSQPFDKAEGTSPASVTKKEWFGSSQSDPRHSAYETYLERYGSLKNSPGSAGEKRKFLETKINVMRDGILSGHLSAGQTIEALVNLERQWETFVDAATLQRAVNLIGEIVEIGRTIDEIAQKTEGKLKESETISFENRLRVYLAKDTETQQFNDALGATHYVVDSEAYRAWFQSTDTQKKLWEQFSKIEQEQLLNAGIRFQKGADMLRECLASLLPQNQKKFTKRKIA